MYYDDLRSRFISYIDTKQKGGVLGKAYAYAGYLLKKQPSISDADVFVGVIERLSTVDMSPENIVGEINRWKHKYIEEKEKLEYIQDAVAIGLFCRNPGKHMAPAYDKIMETGLQKKLEQIRLCYKENKSQDYDLFYKSEWLVLSAFQQYILKCGTRAKEMYINGGSKSKNLLRIAETCDRIAYKSPKTFFEAVQMLILMHEAVVGEAGTGSISFGRFDQYLYSYYKSDISEGRLTYSEAYEYICELWRKIANYELGWQNVTLGGSDKFGNDVCNELTIMCMDASMAVAKEQPQVSLRVNKNMPDKVWNKAMELINRGMGFPELYNDEMAVKAKINCGIKEDDAWNYAIVGCVEPMIPGKEYSHTEGARINWVKILELILTEDKRFIDSSYKIKDFEDFTSFYDFYKEQLVAVTNRICSFIDIASGEYGKNWQTPFTSCMMLGCDESGKDVTDGGTIYNNLCVICVGFASTVDSLEAIEQLVYKEKIISLEKLVEAISKNFEGYEWLQRRMLLCSKYGNDIESVDKKAKELAELFVNTIRQYPLKYRSGVMQPGFYTSYFHAEFGELTGATPDGRKAHMPLSSSMSAMSGMDKKGPTALINSALNIDMSKLGNGMVLDVKFTKEFFDKADNKLALRCLVESYFERGGLEIQFNIVDKETLIKAQQNPEQYENLIVRVSGFSTYFTYLSKQLQDEIIARTENTNF